MNYKISDETRGKIGQNDMSWNSSSVNNARTLKHDLLIN